MKILNNRLFHDDRTPFMFTASPHKEGQLVPEYLVIHYTAGQTVEGAAAWFMNKKSNASAHLVIGRDGSINQFVPFDTIALHAGPSFWDGRSNLNRFSIGIELDNAGLLKKNGNNTWQAWFRKEYPAEEVIQEPHKNDPLERDWGWHTYTAEQLAAAEEVSLLLVEKYSLLDIIGHDDISPRRKWDPGPAFPMHSFRSKILGRKDREPVTFLTNIDLHIRKGPGSHFDPLTKKPLPAGTRLAALERKISWIFVDVLDIIDGMMDLQGWVLGDHTRRSDIEAPIRFM